MKGVVLSRCPEACIIDITHLVPPFSILAGAYAIDQAAPYFPSGTIHVIVVDPGVGTARRGLAAAINGQIFIAPDNGVLGLVLSRSGSEQIFGLDNEDLWLPNVSSTFHGRDIFAAVAGALATGTLKLADVGQPITHTKVLGGLQPTQQQPGIWQGRILSVDHFGNVVTNFPASLFNSLPHQRFCVQTGRTTITTFNRTFDSAADGSPFAYFGSSGFVEVALKQASFSTRYDVSIDSVVVLEVQES